MEVTVSNTSNGGMVSNVLHQIQAKLRLAVSNTSDFLSFCCIKYKQRVVEMLVSEERVLGNLKIWGG
jgi:hypothetical protein